MKNSLILVLVFVVSCISLDLVGAMGYMIYADCMCYNIGTALELINLHYLLKGLCVVLPFATIAALIATIFYMIRHSPNKWIGITVYSVLTLVTWFLIIPFSYKLTDIVEKNYQADEIKVFLSPEYFREGKDGTYYFRSIDKDNKAAGIVINNGSVSTFENLDVFEAFQRKNKAESLHDPLFDSTLTPPGIINLSLLVFKTFNEVARYSYQEKGLYLATLFSLALALSTIYCFSKFSKWRLCNVSLVIMAFIVVILLNISLYASPISAKIIAFFVKKKWTFLADVRILQLIINSILIIAALVVGIMKEIKNPYANREEQ